MTITNNLVLGTTVTTTAELGFRDELVGLLLMAGDGSRYIVRALALHVEQTLEAELLQWQKKFGTQYPNLYMRYWGTAPGDEVERSQYLPYLSAADTVDNRPSSVPDPVNQIPDLLIWKAYTARFAHDLDWGAGVQTALNYSAADREVLWNWGRALIGIVWSTLATWEAIDPNPAVTVDPPAWRAARPGVLSHVEQLCFECEVGSFPRMFLQNADLPAFRNKYAGGQLHGTDRTGEKWVPGMLLDQVSGLPRLTEPQARIKIAQFFEGHKTDFLKALAYWDSTVGHLERPHAH